MDNIETTARYERASRRAKELRDYYRHLSAFVVVNLILAILNLIVSPGTIWFIWPLFGWGIGLTARTVSVFGAGAWLGGSWEARTIRRLMEEDERKSEYENARRHSSAQ